MIIAYLFVASWLAMCLPSWLQMHLALSTGHSSFQLLTYALLHAGPAHLAYNFAFAAGPGLLLEHSVGRLRTLGLCAAMAAASGIAHMLVTPEAMRAMPLVGFSGVAYGLVAMGALVAAEDKGLLVKLALAATVAGVVMLEAAQIGGFDFVAHGGHVGGALTGMLLYGLMRGDSHRA